MTRESFNFNWTIEYDEIFDKLMQCLSIKAELKKTILIKFPNLHKCEYRGFRSIF